MMEMKDKRNDDPVGSLTNGVQAIIQSQCRTEKETFTPRQSSP